MKKRALALTLISFTLSAIPLMADDKVSITTLSGKSYEGKITRVEASGIVVMHSGGIARIDFDDLSADDQKKYGYDPVKASQERAAMANADQARRNALMAQRQKNEAAKMEKKLVESAEKQTYKVFSVVAGEGILANEFSRGGRGGAVAGAISSLTGGSGSTYVAPKTGDLVFLSGEIPTVVDEDVIDAMVVPDGTYQYETVQGSVSTVKKFRVLKSSVDE